MTVNSLNEQLRELFATIVRRDGTQLSRSLIENPSLAQAALTVNGSKKESEFFIADIFRQVYVGDTALHVAAATHWPDGLKQLLAAGASVHAQNRHSQRPLHYACSGGPERPNWEPTQQAATIEALLLAGAEVNAMANGGVTPLHTAVRNRCALAVEALRRGGADAGLKNKSGSTPQHLTKVNSGRGNTGSEEAKRELEQIKRLLYEPPVTK